jgi:hypothetical protein
MLVRQGCRVALIDVAAPQNSEAAQPKPKLHNAKLCPLTIRKRMVIGLAAGINEIPIVL